MIYDDYRAIENIFFHYTMKLIHEGYLDEKSLKEKSLTDLNIFIRHFVEARWPHHDHCETCKEIEGRDRDIPKPN